MLAARQAIAHRLARGELKPLTLEDDVCPVEVEAKPETTADAALAVSFGSVVHPEQSGVTVRYFAEPDIGS